MDPSSRRRFANPLSGFVRDLRPFHRRSQRPPAATDAPTSVPREKEPRSGPSLKETTSAPVTETITNIDAIPPGAGEARKRRFDGNITIDTKRKPRGISGNDVTEIALSPLSATRHSRINAWRYSVVMGHVPFQELNARVRWRGEDDSADYRPPPPPRRMDSMHSKKSIYTQGTADTGRRDIFWADEEVSLFRISSPLRTPEEPYNREFQKGHYTAGKDDTSRRDSLKWKYVPGGHHPRPPRRRDTNHTMYSKKSIYTQGTADTGRRDVFLADEEADLFRTPSPLRTPEELYNKEVKKGHYTAGTDDKSRRGSLMWEHVPGGHHPRPPQRRDTNHTMYSKKSIYTQGTADTGRRDILWPDGDVGVSLSVSPPWLDRGFERDESAYTHVSAGTDDTSRRDGLWEDDDMPPLADRWAAWSYASTDMSRRDNFRSDDGSSLGFVPKFKSTKHQPFADMGTENGPKIEYGAGEPPPWSAGEMRHPRPSRERSRNTTETFMWGNLGFKDGESYPPVSSLGPENRGSGLTDDSYKRGNLRFIDGESYPPIAPHASGAHPIIGGTADTSKRDNIRFEDRYFSPPVPPRGPEERGGAFTNGTFRRGNLFKDVESYPPIAPPTSEPRPMSGFTNDSYRRGNLGFEDGESYPPIAPPVSEPWPMGGMTDDTFRRGNLRFEDGNFSPRLPPPHNIRSGGTADTSRRGDINSKNHVDPPVQRPPRRMETEISGRALKRSKQMHVHSEDDWRKARVEGAKPGRGAA